MFKIQKYLSTFLFCLTLTACHSITTQEQSQQTESASLNTQLGLAYLQRHELGRAKEKLVAALDGAPNMPEALYAMGYYQEVTGNLGEAKKYYEKSLKLAPTRGDVQNNYGTFLCRHGDYSKSLKYFLAATQDQHYLDSASAYENAGLCALKLPNQTLSENYFNQAINIDSNHPISLLELAKIHLSTGNLVLARIRLNEFLAIAPANSQSRMLAQALMRGSAGPSVTKSPYNHKKAHLSLSRHIDHSFAAYRHERK